MAEFGKKALATGLLTLAFAGAATDNRAFAQQAPRKNNVVNVVSAQAAAKGEFDSITGITKDGKQIKVNMTVPPLDKGMYKEDQFHQAMSAGVMMAVITTFSKYTEAEIPGNIAKIQKELTAQIGNTVAMGTVTPDGKPGMAKPGVNYGNVTVTKVAESTGKVVFEQKAAAKPPSGPKAKA